MAMQELFDGLMEALDDLNNDPQGVFDLRKAFAKTRKRLWRKVGYLIAIIVGLTFAVAASAHKWPDELRFLLVLCEVAASFLLTITYKRALRFQRTKDWWQPNG